MTEADAAHDMEAAFEPSRTANRAEAMMDRLAVLRQAGRLPGETRWIWPDRDPEPVGNGKSGMAPVLAARPRHVQGEPGRGGAAVILRIWLVLRPATAAVPAGSDQGSGWSGDPRLSGIANPASNPGSGSGGPRGNQ
jgi:hypothetical protein